MCGRSNMNRYQGTWRQRLSCSTPPFAGGVALLFFALYGMKSESCLADVDTTPRVVVLYSKQAASHASEWDEGARRAGWIVDHCLTLDFESQVLPKLSRYDAIITATVWNLYDKVDFTTMGPAIAEWVREGGILILGDQNYGPQLDFLKSFPAGFYHFVRPGFYWESGKRPSNMKLPPPDWVADIGFMRAPMDLRPHLQAAARPCWQSLGELSPQWQPLVRYPNGHILMAAHSLGKGIVLSLSYYLSASFPDFQQGLLRNLWCRQKLAVHKLELTHLEMSRDAVLWRLKNNGDTDRQISVDIRVKVEESNRESVMSRMLHLKAMESTSGAIPCDFAKPAVYLLTLQLIEGGRVLWHTSDLRHEVLPPLEVTVFKSYFYASPFCTIVRINTPEGTLPHGTRISHALRDSKGKHVRCNLVQAESAGDYMLTSGKLTPDAYTLIITARGDDGKLASAQATVAVLGKRRVMFDENNNCIISGKPFFPLGIYFPKPSRFAAVREQGFNFMYWLLPRGWGTREEYLGANADEEYAECLRLAEQAGLMNLPYVSAADFNKQVPLLKQSRSTLGYYLWDEPDEARPGVRRMREWYHQLRQLDPEHPVFLLANKPEIFDLYSPYCDIYASDPYPLGRRPLRMVAEWTDQTITAVYNQKPVWMTLWAYGGHKNGPRLPTPAELNCMSWIAIAHGAKGLFYYCYYTGAIGRDQTLEDFPELWACFRPMLLSIREAEPMLFAPPVKPVLKVTVDDISRSAALHTLEKQVGAKRNLLLVNDEERSLPLSVTVGKATVVRDLLTHRTFVPQNGSLNITLGGLEALVLEVAH